MIEPRRPIAKTVVQDDCFTVDGQAFPWHITVPGAVAVQINENLFLVTVTIICVSDDEVFRQDYLGYPVIDGVEFPWPIVDGVTFRHHRQEIPTVVLTFPAESITGVPIDSVSPPRDSVKVKDITGRTVFVCEERARGTRGAKMGFV